MPPPPGGGTLLRSRPYQREPDGTASRPRRGRVYPPDLKKQKNRLDNSWRSGYTVQEIIQKKGVAHDDQYQLCLCGSQGREVV